MTNAEAIEHLKDILDDVPNDKCIDWIEALNKAIEVLGQEPKTGHWIKGNYHIRCSECGEDYTYRLRNYCPNCGAKMQEVEE